MDYPIHINTISMELYFKGLLVKNHVFLGGISSGSSLFAKNLFTGIHNEKGKRIICHLWNLKLKVALPHFF